MTPRELLRYRLIHQQIASDARTSPAEVVAALGGMQAQDYSAALWSIGLRAQATEAEVEKALAERSILRTWPMRGTLHIIAAKDVRWMLDLLTPRIIAGSAGRHRELELNDAIFAKSTKLFVRALRGGKSLTRPAMCDLLNDAKISPEGQRAYHILWRLAQEGVICFGAREGKQHTFALLDEWAPDAQPRGREESLAELALRYVTSHGPATLEDFVWWSGLKISDSKAALKLARPQLTVETYQGAEYWLPNAASAKTRVDSLYLLPGFDEYIIGYTDRSAALDPIHSNKIVPGGNGMFMPTIAIQGRIEGTWKRTLARKSVSVQALPFAPLKDAETRAFAAKAKDYGTFLGVPVEF